MKINIIKVGNDAIPATTNDIYVIGHEVWETDKSNRGKKIEI